MRDADEWAQSLNGCEYVDDDSGWQTHKIAALIREAQQDGMECERARRVGMPSGQSKARLQAERDAAYAKCRELQDRIEDLESSLREIDS